MNIYPLLHLAPIFDSAIQQISSILKTRFELQAFHHNDLHEHLNTDKSPWILLCDTDTFAWLRQHYPSAAFSCYLHLEEGQTFDPEWQDLPQFLDYNYGTPDVQRLSVSLNRLYTQLHQDQEIQRLSRQIELQRHRLKDLNQIGASLSTERNLDQLLVKILDSSMEITASDSGSLYLVEPKTPHSESDGIEQQQLRFKWSRCLSLELDFSEFVMDLNERSISGSVAVHGKALNISDVYDIGSDVPYGFNKSFDQNTGYRSKSMLTVPMKNPKGDVIGVLQVINKKRTWKKALDLNNETALNQEIQIYTREDEELLSSLASQAAVAIENARLYASIQSLFEGFIRASVQAIESRDPTTSGHSERVAVLTVGLAKRLDRISEGSYAQLHFSRNDLKEINYASLLHDFGKIGVREHVLIKAEKLYPHELKDIQHRFRYIRKSLENSFHIKKLDLMLRLGNQEAQNHFATLEGEYQQQLAELAQDFELILQANKPSILHEEVSEKLSLIQQKHFAVDQEDLHLLEAFELSRLSIKKGTLDLDERLEIESHVTHTFHFLSQIPWTRELRNVPQIAYAHHEKLNGRGYPRGLSATDIPIQSKMMTIADIYDALTASDRPYKKALPVQRALDILGYEVKDGMLDAELYTIFVDSKVYEDIPT